MYNKIRLFKKGKINMIGIYFSGTGNMNTSQQTEHLGRTN